MEPIEPKTCENKAKQNKHVKAETKQKKKKKLGFLGNVITYARTSLHAHNQACMRQDYVYVSPCPKNLETQKQSTSKKNLIPTT